MPPWLAMRCWEIFRVWVFVDQVRSHHLKVCAQKLHNNRQDFRVVDQRDKGIIQSNRISKPVIQVARTSAIFCPIASDQSIPCFDQTVDSMRIQCVADNQITVLIKKCYIPFCNRRIW